MKGRRSIIRAVWGDFDNIRDDVITAMQYDVPCHIFVYGDKNMEELYKIGIGRKDNCWLKQLDYCPTVWDMETELWRHKLDVLDAASDYDFDEILFLDWDCIPVRTFDVEEMWNELGKKEVFQANLYQYHTKRCLWRNEDWRKVCNGGFVYLRDTSIASEFVENWDRFKEELEELEKTRQAKGKDLRVREKYMIYDDEPAMSKWVDDYLDGWQGAEVYCELFEPSICELNRNSAVPEHFQKVRNPMFRHML